jgi:hypothetical protein
MTEYLFNQKEPVTLLAPATKYISVDHPQSGTKRAMVTIYTHVLDTFISVLSSVSSHILHSVFYDVIEPTLMQSQDSEVRVFACRIADKLLTICQGDLLISPPLLSMLLKLISD